MRYVQRGLRGRGGAHGGGGGGGGGGSRLSDNGSRSGGSGRHGRRVSRTRSVSNLNTLNIDESSEFEGNTRQLSAGGEHDDALLSLHSTGSNSMRRVSVESFSSSRRSSTTSLSNVSGVEDLLQKLKMKRSSVDHVASEDGRTLVGRERGHSKALSESGDGDELSRALERKRSNRSPSHSLGRADDWGDTSETFSVLEEKRDNGFSSGDEDDVIEQAVLRKMGEVSLLSRMPPHRNVVRYYGAWMQEEVVEKQEIGEVTKLVADVLPYALPPTSNELLDVNPSGGVTRSADAVGPRDFTLVRNISAGAYGQVYLVRYKPTRRIYAMKVIQKSNIKRKNAWKRLKLERDTMLSATSQALHVVKLMACFQSPNNCFFVMEYCPGGDLAGLIDVIGPLSEGVTRQYISELTLIVEGLHRLKIVHRDIKVDNLLIDAEGHLKLTDFGLSSFSEDGSIGDGNVLLNSCVGTPTYLAPEVIEGTGHGPEVDWWSVGTTMYVMLCARHPFSGKAYDTILDCIVHADYSWPSRIKISTTAKSLVSELLQPNLEQRLGTVGGATKVRQHAFFEGVDWDNAFTRPSQFFVPQLDGEADTGYFPVLPNELHVKGNLDARFAGAEPDAVLRAREELQKIDTAVYGDSERNGLNRAVNVLTQENVNGIMKAVKEEPVEAIGKKVVVESKGEFADLRIRNFDFVTPEWDAESGGAAKSPAAQSAAKKAESEDALQSHVDKLAVAIHRVFDDRASDDGGSSATLRELRASHGVQVGGGGGSGGFASSGMVGGTPRVVPERVIVMYIQTQYYEYTTLRRWLDLQASNDDARRIEVVLHLVRQLFDGLRHIHEYGIYHRDLKPENIFMSIDDAKDASAAMLASRSSGGYTRARPSDVGDDIAEDDEGDEWAQALRDFATVRKLRLVIGDFGLAARVAPEEMEFSAALEGANEDAYLEDGAASDMNERATGAKDINVAVQELIFRRNEGTLLYVAPEQVRMPEDVRNATARDDRIELNADYLDRIDIYAAGLVWCELLLPSLHAPSSSAAHTARLRSLRRGALPRALLAAPLTRAQCKIILRCLERTSSLRPSAKEVLTTLREVFTLPLHRVALGMPKDNCLACAKRAAAMRLTQERIASVKMLIKSLSVNTQ